MMSHTIKDLERILGYTEDQVRVRLDRFAEALEGHVRKGRFNRIEVTDSGLVILERAKTLEDLHGDLRTVRSLLGRDGRNEAETEGSITDGNSAKHVLVDQAKLVETLERENEHLREEIAFLRARIEELMPLALPRPRRPAAGGRLRVSEAREWPLRYRPG